MFILAASQLLKESPTFHEHNGKAVIENGNAGDSNGEILTSEVNNGGESVVTEEYMQNDEHALMVSGVYVGLCKGGMGSPISIRNGGFCLDEEDSRKQNGFHAGTKEQKVKASKDPEC